MTRLSSILNFNKPLPSPVSRDYKWVGLYNPFTHQINTTEFLTINKKLKMTTLKRKKCMEEYFDDL